MRSPCFLWIQGTGAHTTPHPPRPSISLIAYAFFRPHPLLHCREATIALITEGGLVPKGNPDRLESGTGDAVSEIQLSGHGRLGDGMCSNPSIRAGIRHMSMRIRTDSCLFDAMCDLEANRTIGKVHRYFYTTTGVAITVEAARKIGRDIAAELKLEGVSAAILTAT